MATCRPSCTDLPCRARTDRPTGRGPRSRYRTPDQTRGQAADAWPSGAASSRSALRAVQAVVLAGQLMVVPENSACLVDLPSAQLTGVVSVRISRITQVGTKVLPVTYLRLLP